MQARLKQKILATVAKSRLWIARYGWAEVASIATSYLGYFSTVHVTQSTIAGAFGAAIGENVGYYSCIIWRELASRRRMGETFTPKMLAKTAWALLLEFGVAELLDSFVVRPSASYLAVDMFGTHAGIIIGKLAADAVFYVLVITIYTRLKARKNV